MKKWFIRIYFGINHFYLNQAARDVQSHAGRDLQSRPTEFGI